MYIHLESLNFRWQPNQQVLTSNICLDAAWTLHALMKQRHYSRSCLHLLAALLGAMTGLFCQQQNLTDLKVTEQGQGVQIGLCDTTLVFLITGNFLDFIWHADNNSFDPVLSTKWHKLQMKPQIARLLAKHFEECAKADTIWTCRPGPEQQLT